MDRDVEYRQPSLEEPVGPPRILGKHSGSAYPGRSAFLCLAKKPTILHPISTQVPAQAVKGLNKEGLDILCTLLYLLPHPKSDLRTEVLDADR